MQPQHKTNLLAKLTALHPKRFWWRRWARQAAVAVLIIDRPPTENNVGGLSILLMKRAAREGDPWSGDMSFPGGRMAPEDQDDLATALREFTEETGFDLIAGGAKKIGGLSDVLVRGWHWHKRPFIVTPYLFWLDYEPTDWQIDPTEVDILIWIPISFFLNQANRDSMVWKKGNLSLTVPCYDYGPYPVWGLTLRMIDELLTVLKES